MPPSATGSPPLPTPLPCPRSRSRSHSATPPHQPLYNVHASETSIRQAVASALPGVRFISSTPLPHGASFNNRIYTVRVGHSATGAEAAAVEVERELIYKVSGRAWRQLKTLNEVMCLRLVERWCPDLPVPRVLAWCNDRGAVRGGQGDGDSESENQGGEGGGYEGNEWILMDRLPGDLTAALDPPLSDTERESLAVEYASIIAAMRSKIPSPGCFGNVVDVTADGQAVLGDVTLNTAAAGAPWESFLEYYSALLQSEVELLKTDPVYESAADLIPLLQKFIIKTVPKLPIFQDVHASKSIFTHNDLADRNILITRPGSLHQPQDPLNPTPPSPLIHITGLIDFEFSGFFPFFDDFVSLSSEPILGVPPTPPPPPPAHSKERREHVMLESLFKHMDCQGCVSPLNPVVREHWSTAVLLRQVLDNVAPWWVRGKKPSAKVEEELVEPFGLVREALEELSGF